MYNREFYSNFMKIEKIFRRKMYNLKFGINQINNKSKSRISIVLPPVKTVIVPAQGDTGANVSATNDKRIIHIYLEYDSPSKFAVFSDESKTDVMSLIAVEQVTMKIILYQGSVMNWSILYTPSSTGTVISPDHYHQSYIFCHFSLIHSCDANCNGKIAFLDNNERKVESIRMRRTNNGEWMITNQVLVETQPNHHIVNVVNLHSKYIKKQQLAANAAIQREGDDIELFQQRSDSWTTPLNSHVIDQMVGNSHNTATTIPTDSIATSPASGPSELTPAPTMEPPLTTNLPSELSNANK